MTYRSRSGGPKKHAGKPGHGVKKSGPGRKLHHKPVPGQVSKRDANEGDTDSDPEPHDDIEEEDETPATYYTSLPTNDEILNVLRWALNDTLQSDEFPALVQKAKSLLYERKWLELFTDPSLLDAYAGRWVPSRALCFRELLAQSKEVRAALGDVNRSAGPSTSKKEEEETEKNPEEREEAEEGKEGETCGDLADKVDALAIAPSEPQHILSLGGGAGSEMLAVAALASRGAHVAWTGVDVGSWGGVIERIEAAARDKWRLNATFQFIEGDLLAPTLASPSAVPGPTTDPTTHSSPAPAFSSIPALASVPAPDITTLFFTLTELLSQNRARTVALLRAVTAATPRGGLLMVADSASDIAEFPLGKDGRTWPVYMVLDAVLGAIGRDEAKSRQEENDNQGKGQVKGGWEKVTSDDSRWFRLSGERWPVKLENCRYWLRVYRRL